MHFVLYEEVDERDDASIEGTRHVFSVLNGFRIRWAERDTAKCPWDSGE